MLDWRFLKIYFSFCSISIDYGQAAAAAEIDASQTICAELQIAHDVIRLDCSVLGMGDMMKSQALPKTQIELPSSEWWPFRNQLLLTFGAARSLALGVTEIYTGSVKTDGRFMDGTSEFYRLMDLLISMQEGKIHVRAPAIEMDSIELLRKSNTPLSLAAWSHSCHRSNIACGQCKGCEKRKQIMYTVWGSS